MINVDWGMVDKVVYINLARRTDRRAAIETEIENIGIPADKVIRFDAIENEEGALGCVMSHRAVLQMAREQGWNNVLILEDDMVFHQDDDARGRINYFLGALNNTPWSAGFLSGSYFRVKKQHGCFYRIYHSYLANSYLVNRPYLHQLISVFDLVIDKLSAGESRNNCCLDVYWNILMKNDHWYAVYPCVGYQMADMSDIERGVMDRIDAFSRVPDGLVTEKNPMEAFFAGLKRP